MLSQRLLFASSVLVLASCSAATTDAPGSMCETPAPVACATAVTSRMPLDLTGSTVMASDGSMPSCTMQSGGRDLSFQFTAPSAGRYEITTLGSSFDTVLSVRRGCGGEEIACNDDARPGMETRSAVTIDLGACETVIIVVDGFSAAEMGDVALHVTTRESLCDNGLDDDGDGALDCEDTDCFSSECSGGGAWPADWQAFEWQVLELTNQRRAMGATCDMDVFGPAPALEMDAVIQEAARGHSLDMGMQAYFEHDGLDGRGFDDRMRDVGFMGASPWGENIAAGQPSATEVVEGWMNSPGHCRNIMNPDYRTIGIGYAYVEGSPFGHYWTQDFAASH